MAALELDLALAEYGQQETWRHVREASGEPDWFVSMLLLVMDLV